MTTYPPKPSPCLPDHDYEAVNKEYDSCKAALVEALKFYRDGWHFKTLKNRAGLEWFPSEELLEDCGNKAKEALAALQEERK